MNVNKNLFNVEDSIMNVSNAGGPWSWDDVPEVERLTVGIGDRHVDHLAHVVFEEQARVLVVVHQIS